MNHTLLIELQVEELPPLSLEKLGNTLAHLLFSELLKKGFTQKEAQVKAFASPRRLAASITHVQAKQFDQTILKKGPCVSLAYENNQPTAALKGFATAANVSINELFVYKEGDEAIYAYEKKVVGKTLSECLPDILMTIFKKLSNDTLMRWADWDALFFRPIHQFIALYDDQVLPFSIFHLQSGQKTAGHRFLGQREIVIDHAENYENLLETKGKVIASFPKRRAMIDKALTQMAASLKTKIANKGALLDEVTALVEWPRVLVANFDEAFLRLPEPCLILTMQQHQKYFPLLDLDNRLTNRFLLVTNLEGADSTIIAGNERVIRARFLDAAFFFDQDRQKKLEEYTPQFAHIVYHNRLGTQLERVSRLQNMVVEIAHLFSLDLKEAARAAYLCKADLLTDMVCEFPALQGEMGFYYAKINEESDAVCLAIKEHYYPRFSSDKLPETLLGKALALSDKLETLWGIMGIGIMPTGDKDPFGLRRAALGILRILLTVPVDLKVLTKIAHESFEKNLLSETTFDTVYPFCLERLKYYLIERYESDIVEAVLVLKPTQFGQIIRKIEAIKIFKTSTEAPALIATNKRVKNILRKSKGKSVVNPDFFVEKAEHDLFKTVEQITPLIDEHLKVFDFQEALKTTASFKGSIDTFFDEVMVFVEEAELKNNRLALLHQVHYLLNCVADITLLDL